MAAAWVALGATQVGRAQTTLETALVEFDTLSQGYNLISFGNASITNYGDTQGPLAIAGNLTLGGAGQIAEHASAAPRPTLFVSGQLNLDSGQQTRLAQGFAYLPNVTGTWNSSTRVLTTANGGQFSTINSGDPLAGTDPRTTLSASPWDWSSLSSGMVSISNTLASATATGTIGVSGQNLIFNANGQTSGVVVFNLDGNAFNGNLYDADGNGSFDQNNERVSNVQVNVPEGLVFVINVTNFAGDTLLGGMNTNAGTGNQRLLWNITPESGNSSPVTLGGGASFYGAVLAPLVELQNGPNLMPNSQVVAAGYTHSGAELHYIDFSAPITFSVVPEPGTWGLAGLGGIALAIGCRRRRRRAKQL